ncbi:MAG: DNA translocase FtsK 4TM domain-containing protein [Paracoccaceae bacterium]|nr:DNA translocase FtsK 4TM domain-containing protein [Paracoccaceae bacterium]
MAYHQTQERSPFLDRNLQMTLERRGIELVGLGLIGLGILIGMMISSYSPEDPSWLSATDAPVQNILGVTGASIAAPVMLILGWASWCFAALSTAWGIRCFMHKGAERALWRLIFSPFAIALMSLYCASVVPPLLWTHSFGMGGLFGDTFLQQLLTLLPVSNPVGVTILSFVTGIAFIAMCLYCMGFTRIELNWITRFLMVGFVLSYASLMTILGRGTSSATQAALALQVRQARRQKKHRQMSVKRTQEPALTDQTKLFIPRAPHLVEEGEKLEPEVFKNEEKQSFLGLMPAFIKRPEKMPEPELFENYADVHVSEMPGDDRIRAKISNVIKSRVLSGPELIVKTSPASKRTELGQAYDFEEHPNASARLEPVVSVHENSSFDDHLAAKEIAVLQDTVSQKIEGADALMLSASGGLPKAESRKVVQPATRRNIAPSARAKSEAQPSLQFEDNLADYEPPPLSLLSNPITFEREYLSDEALEENARLLESVLDDYGVRGEIVSVRPGPVVTMYELEPAPGLKASRVIGLSDDIARSMSALSARVSTIPGRTVIGIELPNESREKVVLREILSAKAFGDGNQKLPIALGKDISGEPMVVNLAKMPHLLIAGTTGSGKSVAINTMILSLLYKLTPEECRLIMIDPKMLELSVYDGIPHLLSPVVTDPKKAVIALKWVVGEMEERYRKMSKMGVRNIDGYNSRVVDALSKKEMFSRTVQTGFDDQTGEPIFETEEFAPEKIPYIVVIVDEMADLMMVAGKEIEACIQRLAQMARASGIHLIMATQRPSVDVITGTIKANFPTRISFQVTSKIDSRTILGEMGAEQLLGMGDMLYMAGGSKITRCHGPFVSDEEVEEVVSHLKAYGPPQYKSGVADGPEDGNIDSIDLVLGLGGNTDGEDALYDQAVAIVLKDRKCSTSYIQRKLAIGYNKAARLVEQMEDDGLVTAANHVGKRDILISEQQ